MILYVYMFHVIRFTHTCPKSCKYSNFEINPNQAKVRLGYYLNSTLTHLSLQNTHFEKLHKYTLFCINMRFAFGDNCIFYIHYLIVYYLHLLSGTWVNCAVCVLLKGSVCVLPANYRFIASNSYLTTI